MLAKLICARHKPRQQSILPSEYVEEIFKETPISDVRMLGGKLGSSLIEQFSISVSIVNYILQSRECICRDLMFQTMAELAKVEFDRLSQYFGGQARWVWQMARGIDDEPVCLMFESYIMIEFRSNHDHHLLLSLSVRTF